MISVGILTLILSASNKNKIFRVAGWIVTVSGIIDVAAQLILPKLLG